MRIWLDPALYQQLGISQHFFSMSNDRTEEDCYGNNVLEYIATLYQ